MSEPAVAGRNGTLGVWSLIGGAASLVGALMIGQATYGWIPGFDPAGWLRVVTGWMLPIGALGAMVLGGLSFTKRSGRAFGIAGILAALTAIGIFIAMIATYPY